MRNSLKIRHSTADRAILFIAQRRIARHENVERCIFGRLQKFAIPEAVPALVAYGEHFVAREVPAQPVIEVLVEQHLHGVVVNDAAAQFGQIGSAD